MGQHQIEDGPLRIHHTSRQSHDRHSSGVVSLCHSIVGKQEHCAGKDRGPVRDDPCAGIFDRERRLVIGVYTHSAGAAHYICSFRDHFQDRSGHFLIIVVPDLMIDDLCVKLREFLFDHRCESIPDPAVIDFISGRNNAHFLVSEWKKGKDRLSICRLHAGLLSRAHLLFFNDKGDDPGSCKLIALCYGKSAMPCGDHHLAEAIDRLQPVPVHL